MSSDAHLFCFIIASCAKSSYSAVRMSPDFAPTKRIDKEIKTINLANRRGLLFYNLELLAVFSARTHPVSS